MTILRLPINRSSPSIKPIATEIGQILKMYDDEWDYVDEYTVDGSEPPRAKLLEPLFRDGELDQMRKNPEAATPEQLVWIQVCNRRHRQSAQKEAEENDRLPKELRTTCTRPMFEDIMRKATENPSEQRDLQSMGVLFLHWQLRELKDLGAWISSPTTTDRVIQAPKDLRWWTDPDMRSHRSFVFLQWDKVDKAFYVCGLFITRQGMEGVLYAPTRRKGKRLGRTATKAIYALQRHLGTWTPDTRPRMVYHPIPGDKLQWDNVRRMVRLLKKRYHDTA